MAKLHMSRRSLHALQINKFLGVDCTNEPVGVAPGRSPFSLNMVRETNGQVRKHTGYRTTEYFQGAINGVFFLRLPSGDKRVVHAGGNLCADGNIIFSGIGFNRSRAVQVGNKLYIFDGVRALVYDGETAEPLDTCGRVPVILISRRPNGGGIPLEPVNLIQPKRVEKFLGTAADTVYQLSASGLDPDTVTVQKMLTGGGMQPLYENTHFTVNRVTGQVTFTTAPGESPVLGEDNIFITYAKTIPEYAARINGADTPFLYGVNGGRDRVFLSGNASFCNYDWYCASDDPTYWGDLWYSVIGQADAPIVGYSVISDMLATHKSDTGNDSNIALRRGAVVDGQTVFSIVGAYQSVGAVSKYAFGVLETEPVYLTSSGIYAVTPSDVLGERYAQLRSYFLNGMLTREHDLGEAVSAVYDRMYLLAVNNRVYILDGQQTGVPENAPFSHRQYEGYIWDDTPVKVWFVQDGNLCFGTPDGRICVYNGDYSQASAFSNDGVPVRAVWRTAEFTCGDFDRLKNFRRISVMLGAAVATGCRIWALYNGTRELLREYDNSARFFTYGQFSYSHSTYSCDLTPHVLVEKIRLKRLQKVSFEFENDRCEPFALYEAKIIYE